MKLIIAGSRTMLFSDLILHDISRCMFPGLIHNAKEIISGAASGIDKIGIEYAHTNNKKLTLFPADWDKHGKAAGPIRNKEMAEYGDALLLIWDGESRGSKNMKETMLKLGKPVYEVILRSYNVPEKT